MEIGDLVLYRDVLCYLRAVDPDGAAVPCAELEDAVTGEQLRVPLADVRSDPLAAPGAFG